MNGLFIGLVGALLATNQPQAVSNLIQQNTGMSVNIPNPNNPEEKELEQLMAEDDAAIAQVTKWIQENAAFAAQGGGESRADLQARIMARLNIVRKHYEDFLKRYPDFVRGHLAYASFLKDIGDEEASKAENEKALKLDPKDPVTWNNLADYYCENGPITNAFAYLDKAIALDPTEPVYFHNLGIVVYLYRPDAEAYYHLNEQQVFDKSITLYHKAMQLDPADFSLATEYAEGYYGIKPLRTNEALVAWTNVLQIAHSEVERESVYIHLARVKMLAGFYAEARTQLNAVTNEQYASLKHTLEDAINWHENRATNSAAADDDEPINGSVLSTNNFVAPTEVVLTNAPSISTNAVPVLTNALPLSSNVVTVLPNISPIPPKAFALSLTR